MQGTLECDWALEMTSVVFRMLVARNESCKLPNGLGGREL